MPENTKQMEPVAQKTATGFTKAARLEREKKLRLRSTIIASSSTVLVLLAIFILVPMSPGWEKVQRSFFNGEVFQKTFPTLLEAFILDVQIFVIAAPLIAIWGLIIAIMRDARSPVLYPLRLFAIFYNDIFRGVPVILTIYLIGFGIPGLGLMRPWNSPFIWGTVALVLSYSAYVAETYRAGIESIHESQRSAAKSLGLGNMDIMCYVVLPQAIRRVVPANMNNLISLQKDVALLSFIGPVELLRQANVFKSLYANFTPYFGAALIFLAVTIPTTRYADYLMAKQNRERS